MKDQVTVNGVQLSREQIESAYKELNQPDLHIDGKHDTIYFTLDFRQGVIEARSGGQFSGLGFYLGHGFDWAIRQDDEGSLVLIPSLKNYPL